MGFGPQTLAAVDGQGKPIFPLSDLKKHYKIDRRWLSEAVGVDAAGLSRTANSAADYAAVGIDAAWLLIQGLDAACMRRFADSLSLADWVTTLKLENAIATKIGLSMPDFVSMGWDWESLISGLDYSERQLEALGMEKDSVGTGFGGKARRRAHLGRKKLEQAQATRQAVLRGGSAKGRGGNKSSYPEKLSLGGGKKKKKR